VSQPLSPLAARLALQVAAAGNKRIPVEELLASAQEHDLNLVGETRQHVLASAKRWTNSRARSS